VIKLYDYPLSGSCYKVRLMLAFLGLEYQSQAVNFYPLREHRSPAFRSINPLGQLPVLEDGDLRLRDAQAIITYLARKYDSKRRWYPESPELAGVIAMWLAFAGGELMSAAAARSHDMLNEPLDVKKARAEAHEALRVLDDHLLDQEAAEQDWIAPGDHPTIADIACFPHAAMAHDGGVSLTAYRAVWRWIDRVKWLPGFVGMPGIPNFPQTYRVQG